MVRTWDWGKLTFVVTMHEDLSLPIERLGGGKFNAMKFAKPILSPRNMIRIIEGVMESGRGRGHGPPPFILIAYLVLVTIGEHPHRRP